jgi:hypothetical protein
VNQRYDYYVPLRAIFGDNVAEIKSAPIVDDGTSDEYSTAIQSIPGIRLAILAGVLVRGSTSQVDVLFVGNLSSAKVTAVIKLIEKGEGRDINYSVLSYDEFYYRLSIRDRFITEILNGKYTVVVDKDNVLADQK